MSRHLLCAWRQPSLRDWTYLHVHHLSSLTFGGVAHAGKVLSKCGKCARYMKLISIRPMRLYCPTCEEVLNLPQVGGYTVHSALPAYSLPTPPVTIVHQAIIWLHTMCGHFCWQVD